MGICFPWFCCIYKGMKLRCGVGRGILDKIFESFLWIAVSVHQDVDVHFLNSHVHT